MGTIAGLIFGKIDPRYPFNRGGTMTPFHIVRESPYQLDLATADRRWIILSLATLFVLPFACFGVLAFMEDEIRLFGASSIMIGLFLFALILMIAPFKLQLTIDSTKRTVTLNRFYLLGENIREKDWSFNEITDANLVKKGMANLIEIDINGKKANRYNFGVKTKDAQRSYHILQSWLRGLAPNSSAAASALDELINKKQNLQVLKNAEKLLYYFGGFSLIGGTTSLFAEQSLTSTPSITTILSLITGFLYLACGYGAKRRFETALWIAIVVVLAERLYWFIQTMSLGNGSWSTWLTWIFAIFVVSSLWSAIRSIRAVEEEPVFEPLV